MLKNDGFSCISYTFTGFCPRQIPIKSCIRSLKPGENASGSTAMKHWPYKKKPVHSELYLMITVVDWIVRKRREVM